MPRIDVNFPQKSKLRVDFEVQTDGSFHPETRTEHSIHHPYGVLSLRKKSDGLFRLDYPWKKNGKIALEEEDFRVGEGQVGVLYLTGVRPELVKVDYSGMGDDVTRSKGEFLRPGGVLNPGSEPIYDTVFTHMTEVKTPDDFMNLTVLSALHTQHRNRVPHEIWLEGLNAQDPSLAVA